PPRRSSFPYTTLFRSHWDIDKALVVGFEGLPIYQGNNDYLASIVRDHEWLRPVAFVTPAALTRDHLQKLDQQGFVGISMYLKNQDRKSTRLNSSRVKI